MNAWLQKESMTWIKRKCLVYDIKASTMSARVSRVDCNIRAAKSQLVRAAGTFEKLLWVRVLNDDRITQRTYGTVDHEQ